MRVRAGRVTLGHVPFGVRRRCTNAIGFAIEANARALVEKVDQLVGIPATYAQAAPDLVMGDLLKTMRSSQLFSDRGNELPVVRSLDEAE